MQIAITGPESSGKTTLASSLAKRLEYRYIPEFARHFLEKLNRSYTFSDLDIIAKGQIKLWKKSKTKCFISDTELLVIYIWSIYKYGKVSDFIEKALDDQFLREKFQIYFVCSPNIPWENDPLRENANERPLILELYIKEFKKRNLDFVLLEGSPEERIDKALSTIKSRKRKSQQ
jgi:nicotinamide riboside kinase